MQDYVSMVLLWFATEQQKPTAEHTLHNETFEKLARIEDVLDKVLTAK